MLRRSPPAAALQDRCRGGGCACGSLPAATALFRVRLSLTRRPCFTAQPEEPVVSYLTPLTGLSAELLSQHGVPLPQALATLRAALPRDAVLVGQNIGADVKWLGLREGEDFRGLLDLQGLWRVFNTQYNSWSVFNQEHLARVLLGVDAAQCVPACSAAFASVLTLGREQGGAQRRDRRHQVDAPVQHAHPSARRPRAAERRAVGAARGAAAAVFRAPEPQL